MRNPTHLLTAALAGLLCMTPLAAAQGLLGSANVEHDRGTAEAGMGSDVDEGSHDASFGAATDEASANIDMESREGDDETEEESAENGEQDPGFWDRLRGHFAAFLDRMTEAFEAARANEATDAEGSSDLQVGPDGVQLDGALGDATTSNHLGGPDTDLGALQRPGLPQGVPLADGYALPSLG